MIFMLDVASSLVWGVGVLWMDWHYIPTLLSGDTFSTLQITSDNLIMIHNCSKINVYCCILFNAQAQCFK
jgi:hypothetical protein